MSLSCGARTGVLFDGLLDVSSAAFEAHVSVIRKMGIFVDQEADLALPNVFQRELYVHIAFTEPLIFQPSTI